MKDIVESCKKKISSIILLSLAIILVLITNTKSKAYRNTFEALDRLVNIDYDSWRSDLLLKWENEMEPYQDSIKHSMDTFIIDKKILKDSTSNPFYRISYSYTKSRSKGSYFTPEFYSLESLLKEEGEPFYTFVPDLTSLGDFLNASHQKAVGISQLKENKNLLILEDAVINSNLNKGELYTTLNYYFYRNGSKIYTKSDTLNFMGIKTSGTFPSYLDWIIDQFSKGSETGSFKKGFDPLKIKEDQSLGDYIFGDHEHSYEIWMEIKDQKIEEAFSVVKSNYEREKKTISIFGQELDNTIIALVVPVIFLYLFLLLFVHITDLKKAVSKKKSTYYYWVLMHPNLLGKGIAFCVFFIPIIIEGWLLIEYLSMQTLPIQIIIMAIYIGTTALAFLGFIKTPYIRKKYHKLLKSHV
ncbi:hypothetical protein [Ascidiimonas sp. W6]|uniref:hypothetical protein n=1 Tax=Ascidiimonas meishanensis TaxID=3128903 RepID=UPI0030EDA4A8